MNIGDRVKYIVTDDYKEQHKDDERINLLVYPDFEYGIEGIIKQYDKSDNTYYIAISDNNDWIDSAWVDENWIEFVSHGNIMQKNTLAKFTTNEEFKEELEEFLEDRTITIDSEITIEDYDFSDGQYEVHIEGETFYINSCLIVTKEINFDTL